MTRGLVGTGGALLLLVSGFGALAWAASHRTTVWGLAGARPRYAGGAAPVTRPYAAESLGTVVVGRDAFRVERRPSSVPYDAFRHGSAALGQLLAPKPVLTLRGLVWGAVPEAVVEGLPGVDGARVLRMGDAVGGLRVQRIDPGRAVIAGMDTTWTLTLRRP